MDYDMAIAELKTRKDATAVAILKLDERVTQHDEIIGVLTESLATKEDIAALRNDIRERLDRDELLDERMALQSQRLDDIRSDQAEKNAARETRFNRRMSWAMVGLFIGELILGWFGLHHGK